MSYFYKFSKFVVSGMKADLYDKINPDWAPSLKLGPHELATPESSNEP
jgi:hypothetical protein